MADINASFWRLEEALQRKEQASQATQMAQVSRIAKDGTVYVVFPESDEEVPLAQATSEASVGDALPVEVKGGKLYAISGNASDPTLGAVGVRTITDPIETAASVAFQRAIDAETDAARAKSAADSAVESAGDAERAAEAANNNLKSVVQGATTVEKAVSVMQTALEAVVDYDPTTDTTTEYFWHDANGAHVLGDTSGYRNDIDSTGMTIVDVNTERSAAHFGADGATIGKVYDAQASDNESHMELDFHSLKLIDMKNNTYFHVSDLRKANGIAEIDDRFVGDGYTEQFELSTPISRVLDPEFSLTVDGSQPGFNYEISYDASIGLAIIYNTSTGSAYVPSIGAVIVISYKTDSELAKAYTFGTREGNVGAFSIAEGLNTTASGMYSHAEGAYTVARGYISHAEGDGAEAGGAYSHAQGYASKAAGYCSNAEGEGSTAQGIAAHSEGQSTAIGDYSHSEGAGYDSESAPSAEGYSSHAEGVASVAGGMAAHAEGYPSEPEYTPGSITVVGTPCTASGLASHAEGRGATADGEASHAQNLGTMASSDYQTALGKYNIEDANGTYAAIIGNGTSSARSNALAVDWSGNVRIAGDVQDMSGNAKYLPLSGGTMTGRLAFNDGTAMPNASTNTDFFAVGFRAFANGGGVWYKGASDFKSWLAPGSLYSKNTNTGFDRDGANPSAALYGEGFTIQDKDGERVTFIRANRLTDGTMQAQLAVANENTSGTEVTNYLVLGINRSGTRYVSFAESAPWRTALGLDDMFQTASASHAWSSNIAAGGTQNVTVTFTVPSGYTIAAIRRVSSGNGYVDIAGYYISGSTVVVALHNPTSSARSSSNGVTVDVLLAKSILF